VANTRAGTVKACRRAKLAPAQGGQIAALHAREGDHVERDQILLELWNRDVAAQLRLARSEARTASARSAEACLVAQNAARDARRIEKLHAQKLSSEEQVDQAQTNASAKEQACLAAQAEVQVSNARISLAEANLERTLLRAPFPGVVAEVNGEVGEFVTPSPTGIPTPPAIDLVDISCLYVSAPIDEVDAPAIRPGMDARLSLDAFPGKHFKGVVQRVAPYVLDVEKQARTVEIETVFLDPNDFRPMLPGYSADVEVILDRHPRVLRVPSEALLENNRVLVYRKSDHVLELRDVKTGLANWQYTEVTAGLNAGDRVVLSVDREGVRAGVRARVEEEM